MNSPTTQVSEITRTSHSKAAEEKLRALQDAHRLAIHMVENPFHYYSICRKTLDDLNAVPAEAIDASLLKNQPSTFSMSLLPSRTSNLSMHPYQVVRADLHDITSGMNNYGYLFDLSQDQPHPPRVTMVDTKSLSSGNKRTEKTLDLKSTYGNDHLPQLAQIFSPYDKNGTWQSNWIKALGGKNGSNLTEQQLNALGNFYINDKKRVKKISQNTAEYNEATVAASTQHISAIVVPSFSDSNDRRSAENENIYLARLGLQAAVIGLNHWREGMQLPVAIYHVTGKKSGIAEVLATTHEELKALAAQSLATLGAAHLQQLKPMLKQYKWGNSSDPFHQTKLLQYNALEECLERELGIKLSEALKQPLSFQQSLKASHAPAPPPHRTSPASDGRY